MSDNPLSGKVSLDVSEFKAGITTLNREIRVVESGFRASASALGDWADSATGLEMRIESLNKQIDLQRQKVAATQRMYAQLAAEKGANSRVAQDMQIKLNRESEALNKLEFEAKQAGSALDKMRAQTDATGKAAAGMAKKVDQTRQPLSALKGQLGEVVQGLSGMHLGALTAAGAILGLANQAKQSLSAYTEYVDEMRKASSAIGVNVEETSRLVQAGDDLRISQETMTGALEKAVDNGFVPSIENLAKLAEELERIQDPAKRADLLSSKFGKSWKEIIPFLEQGGEAIRAATADISDNLVVTEESVNLTNEYKLALDELSDAWTGVWNAFAKNQLPGLSGSLKIFADNIEDLEKGVPLFEVLAKNQRRYVTLENEMTDASKAWAQRYQAQADAHENLSAAIAAGGDSVRAGQMAMEQYYSVLESQAVAQSTAQMETLKAVTDALTTAQQNAKTAMEELSTAQDNWQKGAGGDAASALEQAGVKGEEYEAALKIIDDTMGTSLLTQHEYTEEQARLADEFAKSGDLEAYEQGLQDLESAYMPLEESVRDAREELEKFMRMWGQLESKEVWLKFHLDSAGPGAGPGSRQETKPGDNMATPTATGGDRRRGQMLLVGEEGPELVEMPDNGYVHNAERTQDILKGAGGDINFYLQGGIGSELDYRKLALYVVEEIRRRRA